MSQTPARRTTAKEAAVTAFALLADGRTVMKFGRYVWREWGPEWDGDEWVNHWSEEFTMPDDTMVFPVPGLDSVSAKDGIQSFTTDVEES